MVQILNHYNSKHSLVNKTILGLFFIILLFSIQGKAEAQDAPAAPEITGSISGRVTDQDGQPLAGISVSAYRNTIYFYKDTKTDASGNYRLDGLTTGLYVIEFSDESTQYISQYYKAPQSPYTAQEISVVGNDILGIDAALIKSAKISGKVSVLAGVGAGMVDVNLYRFNENNVDWYSHKYTRISAKEGEETPFLLDQLESGRYRIRVEPTFTDLPDEYYDNSLTLENATDISLTTGAEITGITVILGENPNTADIHGKVTDASGLPLPDIEVTAYLSGSYDLDSVRTTRTTQDGTYGFRQLAPDDHLVYFLVGT